MAKRHFDYERDFHFNPAVLTLDADAGGYFRRELEHIIPEMFEHEVLEVSARDIFPIDRTAPPTSKTITFRQLTRTGTAKLISDYATDIPVVNSYGEEFTGNVRTIATSAVWSIDEVAESEALGRPIGRTDAFTAREVMMHRENSVVWNGDASHGLVGLFTDPNIPTAAVLDPGPGTEWIGAAKTPAQILFDLHECANYAPNITRMKEVPDTLIMPVTQFNYISVTNAGLGTDSTILKYFLANNPYIKTIKTVNEVSGAGTLGADVMIAYRKHPSKLRMQIPMDLQQLAPQEKDLAIKVIWRLKSGGLTVIRPLSVTIREGI